MPRVGEAIAETTQICHLLRINLNKLKEVKQLSAFYNLLIYVDYFFFWGEGVGGEGKTYCILRRWRSHNGKLTNALKKLYIVGWFLYGPVKPGSLSVASRSW